MTAKMPKSGLVTNHDSQPQHIGLISAVNTVELNANTIETAFPERAACRERTAQFFEGQIQASGRCCRHWQRDCSGEHHDFKVRIQDRPGGIILICLVTTTYGFVLHSIAHYQCLVGQYWYLQ